MDVEARAPTLARGFAALCARAESRERLHPLRVLELSSFRAHRDSVVDIACKERPSGCYAGDERARQNVELKFGDFVDLYQACFADRPHWLRDVGDLEFYLCQCPVMVAKPDATCSEPRLPRVMEDLLVPECLKNVQLTQVNLWMSTHAARTGLHFDAYQNVLVVFFGRKVVTLYKPSECANLYPFPVYSKSANHSQVNAAAPDLENHPRFSKAKPMQFTVSAGDALFIPEGWWHQVDSDEFTIAVNYWWEGARVELTKDPDMMTYYARILMDELIKRETDGYLSELRVSYKIDVGVDGVSTIISQFLGTSEKTDRERIVMAVEDQVQQRELQQCLATEHPSEWLALLRGASSELSAVLTGFWDTMADDEGFMTQILSLLGNDEEGTKDALLKKRDTFRRDMGVRACSNLLGIP